MDQTSSLMRGRRALSLRVAQRGSKSGRGVRPLAPSRVCSACWHVGCGPRGCGPSGLVASVWARSANIPLLGLRFSTCWPRRIVTWHLERLGGECPASAWGLRDQVATASTHRPFFQKAGRARHREARLRLTLDSPRAPVQTRARQRLPSPRDLPTSVLRGPERESEMSKATRQ